MAKALAVAEQPSPPGAAADFEQLMLREVVGFRTVYFSLLPAPRRRRASESGALNYFQRAALAENLGSSVR